MPILPTIYSFTQPFYPLLLALTTKDICIIVLQNINFGRFDIMESCKFCGSVELVKSGKVRSKQRYLCKACDKHQVVGDERVFYGNNLRKAALVLYLEGNGFRRIARCLNAIFGLNISFQLVMKWINSAGNIVKEEVLNRQNRDNKSKETLAVVEMDELFTYVKKNLARTVKRANGKEITSEYGLLLIGTQAICLHLKSAMEA